MSSPHAMKSGISPAMLPHVWVRDLAPVGVADLDELPEPLLKHLPPRLVRHERVLLRPKIIPREHNVHIAGGRLQRAPQVFAVEPRHAPENGPRDVRIQVQVQQNLVHAPKIHGRFELGAPVETVAHEHHRLAQRPRLTRLLAHRFIVKPVRAGPLGIQLNLLHGRRALQRKRGHLAVRAPTFPFPVGHAPARHPEVILRQSVLTHRRFRPDVRRALHIPEIDAKMPEQFLLRRKPVPRHQPGGDLR